MKKPRRSVRVLEMKRLSLFLIPSLLTLAGCSSAPHAADAPAWLAQPARTVDNGYLVYIGVGEDDTLERSRFKAEMTAVADLANECSLAPKGTRTEDRYDERYAGHQRSYAKVAVTFEECEAAKRAVDPNAILLVANARLAEELKKYQEMTESTPPPPPPAVAEAAEPGTEPEPAAFTDPAQYYAARQQLVYWKQAVILAPPGAYPPQAPQTAAFVRYVAPVASRVQVFEHHHPAVRQNRPNFTPIHHRRPRSPSPSFSPSFQPRPRFSPPSRFPHHHGGGHHR